MLFGGSSATSLVSNQKQYMKTFGMVFCLLGLALSSCNNQPKEKPVWEVAKDDRQNAILQISSKYKSCVPFDSLQHKKSWTYQIQDFLSKNDTILFPGFETIDILRTDSNFILKIKVGMFPPYFVELLCSNALMDRLYPKLLKRVELDDESQIFLFAKIKQVKKPEFELIPTLDHPDEWPYVQLEASEAFMLKGDLFDFESR